MSENATIDARVEKLKELLFGAEDQSTYAVLDGASVPDLIDKLYENKDEWACLYRGELEPDMAEVAPYLVKLRRESPLTDWILADGWGKHWGVFAITPVGLEALRRHFRHFLRVKGPDGQIVYFRFYDPRVLRIYLPTCFRTEIATVYGPITQFVAEAEIEETALVMAHDPLRIKPLPLALK